MGKLQAQLKAQTEASTKQSKEFAHNLMKMQDTNTELNMSLTKLTAQNTQAAKDLNDAKEKARQLEQQLQDSGIGGKTVWIVIALIAIIALIVVLVLK